jgi:hypothetical protein
MQKIIFALVLSIGSIAQANFNGYLKGFAFLEPSTKTYARLGTRFQTRYSGGFGSKLEYFAAINFEYDQVGAHGDTVDVSLEGNFSRGAGFGIYPVEYYLDLHLQHVDFRLGQQFIFWGAADWVNPTDVINPWDFANMSGEIEDYRLPVMALSVQGYFGEHALQVVIIPGFTPNVVSLPPNTLVYYPEIKYGRPQWGLRLTSYQGPTDFSLYYFRGYDNMHSIRPDYNYAASPPAPIFEVKYNQIMMFGTDFILSSGSWNFKGEAAFLKTADHAGTYVSVSYSNIQSVLGIDYIWSDDLTLNLQYIHKLLIDYSYATEQAAIVSMGLSDHMSAPDEVGHSLSTMISWSPIDYVSSQLMGVYNLVDQDAFVMAFVSWDMADAMNMTVGMVNFQGDPTSTYGRMDEADRIFLELKRSF